VRSTTTRSDCGRDQRAWESKFCAVQDRAPAAHRSSACACASTRAGSLEIAQLLFQQPPLRRVGLRVERCNQCGTIMKQRGRRRRNACVLEDLERHAEPFRRCAPSRILRQRLAITGEPGQLAGSSRFTQVAGNFFVLGRHCGTMRGVPRLLLLWKSISLKSASGLSPLRLSFWLDPPALHDPCTVCTAAPRQREGLRHRYHQRLPVGPERVTDGVCAPGGRGHFDVAFQSCSDRGQVGCD
jgi:hypothetical protein